jgi:hypothetical protein
VVGSGCFGPELELGELWVGSDRAVQFEPLAVR